MRGTSVNPLFGANFDRPQNLQWLTLHKAHPDLGLADPRFLADDMTEAELTDQYPGLTHEEVLAVLG